MALLSARSIEFYLPRRKIKLQKKVGNFFLESPSSTCVFRINLRRSSPFLSFSVFTYIKQLKDCYSDITRFTIPCYFWLQIGSYIIIINKIASKTFFSYLFILSHASNGCWATKF